MEECPRKSKLELLTRERYYTNTIDCVNKMKNQGLYVELGKEEYDKQYKRIAYKCTCGCIVKVSNKARHERTYKHKKRTRFIPSDDES